MIAYLNIRSLNCNFESFETLVHSLKVKPDLIVLSETWNLSNTGFFK